MRDDYRAFLEAKVPAVPSAAFEIEPSDVNPILKPHQKIIVLWMVRGGRRACFASFGLGKTLIQLEVARLVLERSGGRALIVIPLGVRQEFMRDAAMLGTAIRFVRSIEEAGETGIYLTNYETVRDGKLDPLHFNVALLDEAAVLRGFGGTKTFREFMRLFAGDGKTLNERVRGRDVPYRFVATATPSPNDFIELLSYAAYLGVMDVSAAKAQPLDAKILTPAGWTTMGRLRVGDSVIAGDGTPTEVLGIYPQGMRPIYRVGFSDGGSAECDADHLWLTRTQYERNNERRRISRGRTDECATVKTTAAIGATLRSRRNWNHSIPLPDPVQFAKRPVRLDPWLLGLLIGDGCLRETNVVLSSRDGWIVQRAARRLPAGLSLRRTTPTGCDYSVTGTGKKGGRGPGSNRLLNELRTAGLLGKRSYEKRIPTEYLVNSPTVRLSVLRGLMDADGTVGRGSRVSLTTTSLGLSEDVRFLIRSLGGVATVLAKTSWYSNAGAERVAGRTAYCVTIAMPENMNPFSLPRKASLVRRVREPRRYITSVELVETKLAQCIAIAHPSRLYVTNDFALTHNTRFFKRNSEKADSLTLHPHKAREFWLWVASWAVFVQRPSDITGNPADDAGYELPPLDVRWHMLPTDHSGAGSDREGQSRMFKSAALGVVEASREKRDSLDARITKMTEIIDADPDDHFLLWHDLEAERHAIEESVPGVRTVYGSQDLDEREEIIIDFSEGRIARLGAKPVMLGSGCNLQRFCHRAIFVGIGFKFAQFIQAVHRIQRFLQLYGVRLDLLYTEAEANVRRDLERKWKQHDELVANMTEIIREYGLSHAEMARELTRAMGVERVEVSSKTFTLVNNDCVDETRRMASNSVGLILTSIPFSSQYEYSPNYADFGHSDNNEHFFQQMEFLIPELLRVLQPGRIAGIHVKDRIVPSGMTGLGFQVVYPFHKEVLDAFSACPECRANAASYRLMFAETYALGSRKAAIGKAMREDLATVRPQMCPHRFAYMGMKTIVTDVVRENAQTYRLGWSEQCKDGTKMGVGMPEYLLIFRKPPTDTINSYADHPVEKAKPRVVDSAGSHVPFGDGLLPKRKEKRPIVPGSGYSRSRWQIDAHGFTRSDGNRPLMPEDLVGIPHERIFKLFRKYSLENVYNFEHHVRLGEELELRGSLPVTFMLLQPQSWSPEAWTDITRMLTLNGAQSAKGKEMHLCPMQFDLADRAIDQWSEPGDEVYDPFAGLGTVPCRAILKRRRGRGTELSAPYFLDSVAYCKAAEEQMSMPSLFDLTERQGD